MPMKLPTAFRLNGRTVGSVRSDDQRCVVPRPAFSNGKSFGHPKLAQYSHASIYGNQLTLSITPCMQPCKNALLEKKQYDFSLFICQLLVISGLGLLLIYFVSFGCMNSNVWVVKSGRAVFEIYRLFYRISLLT